MKEYMIFIFEKYEQAGGIGDLKGWAEDKDKALKFADKWITDNRTVAEAEYYVQLFDIVTKKTINYKVVKNPESLAECYYHLKIKILSEVKPDEREVDFDLGNDLL